MTSEIIQKQRAAMREKGLDALVLMSPDNIAYTAGVVVPSQLIVRHRLVLCLIPLEGEPEIIVVNIEESFVKSNSTIPNVIAYNEFTQDPVQVLAERIKAAGLGHVGIEFTALSVKGFQTLEKALPDVSFVAIDELMQQLRMIKTPEELQKLRHMGKVAERAA